LSTDFFTYSEMNWQRITRLTQTLQMGKCLKWKVCWAINIIFTSIHVHVHEHLYCRCPDKLKGQSKTNIQGQYTNQGNAEKNDNRQNIKKIHKQHGLPMEREWTHVFRKSKQFLPIAIHPSAAIHTTHILVKEEKRLKRKKHPEMGKN
jgi:hypothetical protein